MHTAHANALPTPQVPDEFDPATVDFLFSAQAEVLLETLTQADLGPDRTLEWLGELPGLLGIFDQGVGLQHVGESLSNGLFGEAFALFLFGDGGLLDLDQRGVGRRRNPLLENGQHGVCFGS